VAKTLNIGKIEGQKKRHAISLGVFFYGVLQVSNQRENF
jgi:hypothetical protein